MKHSNLSVDFGFLLIAGSLDKVCLAFLACLAVSSSVFSASKGHYEIGQYWEYTHQGPRPGAVEPDAIDGPKSLQVVSNVTIDANEGWVIEERFGNDPNVIGRAHVGSDRMQTFGVAANEKNETLMLIYDKPIPYQYVDLAVGESVQIETAVVTRPGNFRVPLSIRIERLEDEAVETQAGIFADCRHYTSVTDSVVDATIAKIPFKEHRQWWYSDEVGANVKEIYTKDPVKTWIWSKGGYTSTSTLMAFGVRSVSEETRAAAMNNVYSVATAIANPPKKRNYKAILAIAACIAAGAIILAKRRKRAKPQ